MNGGNGGCSAKCRGADGSGGSILIRSTDANLNQLRANTNDGLGRIALYGSVNEPVDSIPVPWIGTGWFEVTGTPTMTPIAFPSEVAQDFGTGEDGDLVVALGATYNIHTDHTGTNSACQQGGDAVSYEVKELGNDHARLSVTPGAACLGIGDEILLISMHGDQAYHVNAGNYEFLKIGGIVDDTLYFSAPKSLFYGKTEESDEGIGGSRKVQLVRVPNYDNVSVDGILTGSAWDGSKNGVIVFRVAGVLSGSGVISMDGMGYRGLNTIGCGESFTGFDLDGCASTGDSGGGRKGGTKSNRTPDGGGGGHKNNGTTGSGAGDGMGGRAYGSSELSKLFPGSAGGMAGCQNTLNNGLVCGSKAGGDGGGVIYLIANQIDMPYGIITSNGKGGGSDTGSGAGGSIRLDGVDIEVGDARVDGGTNNSDGSDGYIAVYYQNNLVINAVDHALNVITNVTVTPEPTVVVVPTIDPATSIWHSRTYNYSSGHPNRITDTTDGDAYTYDANGNQVSRLVDGVTQTLVYNAENRLSGVSDDNGNSESYLYDGDGVRVGRVRAGEATYLFMGGMYELTVEIPTGTVTDTKSYYTVAGQVIAVRDTDGLSTLLTDHLGSILGEVDNMDTLVGEQRYLPFGEVRGDVGSNPAVDLSFTGQRALEGTGLLDYHARQYDPSLRTFIQPDSVIPNMYIVQDWNRYSYVHGNPVRFTDPSGNRIIEGCGDQGLESCGATQYEIDRNIQAANEFRQTTERNECINGNDLYCSEFDKLFPKEKGKLWEDTFMEFPCGNPEIGYSDSCIGQYYKYYSISGGVPIVNPITGSMFGFHMTLTIDQYDQKYVGVGFDFGRSAYMLMGTMIRGRMNSRQLPEDDVAVKKYLENFITGNSVQANLTPIYYLGANFSSSMGASSVENGVGVIGLGASWTYTWKISRK